MFKVQGQIITTDQLTLKGIIADAIKIAMESNGAAESKPYISKNEAYSTYGRRIVENWISSGHLKVIKDVGSRKIRISRAEISALAASSNRF